MSKSKLCVVNSSDDESLAEYKKKCKDSMVIEISDSEDSVDTVECSGNNSVTLTKPLKWDQFCWECHKENSNEVKCTICVLTFHKRCMPDKDGKKAIWMCPECKAITNNQLNLNGKNPNDVIKFLTETIFRKERRFTAPDGYIGNPLFVHSVTIEEIAQKTRGCEYVNVSALLLDFKRLYHNCIILEDHHKGEDLRILKPIIDARKRAESLLYTCIDEISTLNLCVDCYMNLRDGFTLVCSKPHLLLWVKYEQHPYWPAKVTSIKKGPKGVHVRFFSDYTIANVAYNNCYLYSKEDPNEWFTDYTDRERMLCQEAIDEAAVYISNLEKKFGSFKFATKYTHPVQGSIDKHLDEMVPGFRNSAKCSIDKSINASNADDKTNFNDINLNDSPTSLPNVQNVENDQETGIHNWLSSPTPNVKCIETAESSMMTPDFIKNMQICCEYVNALNQECKERGVRINELSQEIEMLRGQERQEGKRCKKRKSIQMKIKTTNETMH